MDLDQEAVLPDEHLVLTEEKEKETSSEATTENKHEKETQSSEGENTQKEKEVPFHEHPRWKQREEEWTKRLDETKAEYENRVAQLEAKFTPILQSNEKVEVPAWFKKFYGDDPELYKEYKREQDAENQKLREETIREYEQRKAQEAQAAAAEAARWTSWVDTSIQNLKAQGEVFDDNELKNIALKYKPTDDLGNIDFGLALEILKEKKADEKKKEDASLTARKELAGSTKSTNKGETKQRDYLTHKDFR